MALLKAGDCWREMALKEKCAAVEHALLETAEKCRAADTTTRDNGRDYFGTAKTLMQERRRAREQREKCRTTELSKLIQKEVRRATQTRKRAQVDRILTEFKGLRFIADVRNNGKRQELSSIFDADGSLHSSEQDILDVFAVELYTADQFLPSTLEV